MEEKNQINIELPEDLADGTYCNISIITHSQMEFVLDFVALMPNTPKARVKSRIVMTPINAKRLLRAMMDNIRRFESNHGTIQDNDIPPNFPTHFTPGKA